MFTLALPDTADELLGVVKQFAAERIQPAAADAENNQRPPAELAAELRKMGVAPAVSEQFGGQGVPGAPEAFLVAERLGEGDSGIALELLTVNHVAAFIAAAGDQAQQERYLTRIATADDLVTSVLYYEGFGRGPAELETTAVRDGDSWVLSGRKIAVIRPGEAELAVVVAAVDDEPAAFLLDREQLQRVRVVRDDQAVGKLGVKAARTGVVELDGVRVPDGQRLAAADPIALARTIAQFRLQLPALALGAASASVHYALNYAKERMAFGQPIISYQGVSFPLAEAATDVSAARLNLLALLSELDTLNSPAEIARRTALGIQRAMKAAVNATRIGINSLGGHGYLMDHPVERWYRAVSALSAIDFDPLAGDIDGI